MSGKDITKYRVCVDIVYEDDIEGLDNLDPKLLDGRTELEPIVDTDIQEFSEFYAKTLKNGSMLNVERAAIKTYIAWKLGIGQK